MHIWLVKVGDQVGTGGFVAISTLLCYAQQDTRMVHQLKDHLSSLIHDEMIDLWDYGDILPGTEWEQEILTHLDEAQMILLLISRSFLASKFHYEVASFVLLAVSWIAMCKIDDVRLALLSTSENGEGIIAAYSFLNKNTLIGGETITTITDEFMWHMMTKTRNYSVVILKAGPKKHKPDAERIIWEHGRRKIFLGRIVSPRKNRTIPLADRCSVMATPLATWNFMTNGTGLYFRSRLKPLAPTFS